MQYHRGRAPDEEVWVFGMVDTTTSPSLGYMEIVDCQNAATLLPIIQAHVKPGTIVWSDQWRAYSNVGSLQNVSSHQTVNHSVEFKNPISGVHTNNIESYWERVKSKIKKMKGCKRENLSSYLDEFLWRERYGSDSKTAFTGLIGDTKIQYPV